MVRLTQNQRKVAVHILLTENSQAAVARNLQPERWSYSVRDTARYLKIYPMPTQQMSTGNDVHFDHRTKTYRGTILWKGCEIETIQNMEVRPDDVWVTTFPCSGTALIQEIVNLIITKDFEAASERPLDARFTYLDDKSDEYPYFWGVKYAEGLPRTSPRLIRSHLHYFLLPEELRTGKAKIVHVLRNPNDTLVSLYKLMKSLKAVDDDITFKDYFDAFVSGDLVLNGPWGSHLREYWSHRNDDNTLLLRYEEMQKNLAAAIRSVASFLDQSLTEKEVSKIVEHCSPKNRKRSTANVRVGTSKEWFTPDMDRQMKEMIKRELAGTGLEFPDL